MTNTRMAINGQLNLQAAYTYTLNLSKVFPVERNTSLQHSAQDSTFIVPSHQSGWPSIPPARVSRFRHLRYRQNDVNSWSATSIYRLQRCTANGAL